MSSPIKPLISNHSGEWKLYLTPWDDPPFTANSHRFLQGKPFPEAMIRAGSQKITEEEALNALEAAIKYYTPTKQKK